MSKARWNDDLIADADRLITALQVRLDELKRLRANVAKLEDELDITATPSLVTLSPSERLMLSLLLKRLSVTKTQFFAALYEGKLDSPSSSGKSVNVLLSQLRRALAAQDIVVHTSRALLAENTSYYLSTEGKARVTALLAIKK